MSNCTEYFAADKIEFGRLGQRVLEGRVDGGSITSDAGVMLLGANDRRLGLMAEAARCIADPRMASWTCCASVCSVKYAG